MNKLKEMHIWFCWNFEMRKGKKTKVPYSARGEPTGTSPDHAGQWVTYKEAAAAAKEKALSGIGFVLPEGYVLIDIDDKPLDDPLVKTMLSRCESYTERSVREKESTSSARLISGRCLRSGTRRAASRSGASSM